MRTGAHILAYALAYQSTYAFHGQIQHRLLYTLSFLIKCVVLMFFSLMAKDIITFFSHVYWPFTPHLLRTVWLFQFSTGWLNYLGQLVFIFLLYLALYIFYINPLNMNSAKSFFSYSLACLLLCSLLCRRFSVSCISIWQLLQLLFTELWNPFQNILTYEYSLQCFFFS